MGKLTVIKALQTLLGIELILNGGGSLLWFIPAIMIFYLVVPFYLRLVRKMNNKLLFAIMLVLWFIIMLGLERLTGNHSINIFLCRLPIILLGMLLAGFEGRWKSSIKLILGFLLLITGIFLTQKFGFEMRLNFLITDVFYVTVIPYVMGIILLSDVIFEKAKSYLFSSLGKISLELYCFQMVFGSLIFGKVIRYVDNSRLTFVLVFVIILILSSLMYTGRKRT